MLFRSGTGSYSVTLSPTTLTANRAVTFPDTALTVAGVNIAQTFLGTQTVRAAATQDGIAIAGRAGGTTDYAVTLTPTTLTASQTATFPDASITVAGTNVAQTFTAAQTFQSGIDLTAANIVSDATTGTQIGTAATQKLSFFGAVTVVQPTAVADLTTTATANPLPTPTGTMIINDAAAPTVVELLKYCVELETKLEAVMLRLRNLGLMAP